MIQSWNEQLILEMGVGMQKISPKLTWLDPNRIRCGNFQTVLITSMDPMDCSFGSLFNLTDLLKLTSNSLYWSLLASSQTNQKQAHILFWALRRRSMLTFRQFSPSILTTTTMDCICWHSSVSVFHASIVPILHTVCRWSHLTLVSCFI